MSYLEDEEKKYSKIINNEILANKIIEQEREFEILREAAHLKDERIHSLEIKIAMSQLGIIRLLKALSECKTVEHKTLVEHRFYESFRKDGVLQ